MKNLNIVIKKDGNYYLGYVKEFNGCHTQGKTLKETFNNLYEVLDFYLEIQMWDKASDETLLNFEKKLK